MNIVSINITRRKKSIDPKLFGFETNNDRKLDTNENATIIQDIVECFCNDSDVDVDVDDDDDILLSFPLLTLTVVS